DDPGSGGFGGDGEDARVSVAEFEPRIRVERQHIVFGDAGQQSVDVDGLDRGLTDGGGFASAGVGEDCGQSLAQGLELELVEQAGQLSRVSFAPCEVVEAQSQVDVVEEAIETEVPFHFRDVVAQLLTDLAADRLGVVQHSRQIAVSGEPFRGGLVADAGHSGQIVGLLTDERGQSAVVDGGDAVPVLDGLRRHLVEVADPAFGIEDRHRLRSQLEESLSPLITSTGAPASVPIRVIVARASSASKPSLVTTAMPIAVTMSLMRSIWEWNSGGVFSRPALYSAYYLRRKVCRPRSKANATLIGASSRRTLMRIEMKP